MNACSYKDPKIVCFSGKLINKCSQQTDSIRLVWLIGLLFVQLDAFENIICLTNFLQLKQM